MATFVIEPDAGAARHFGWVRPSGRGPWRRVAEGDGYDAALTALLDHARGHSGPLDLMVLPAGQEPPALRVRTGRRAKTGAG